MSQIKNVAKISAANAEILKEREFSTELEILSVRDANGNWVISLLEAGYLDRDEIYFSIIQWVAPEPEEEI